MYINDFDEYQQAMRKINLNESSLPMYKGRLIESVDAYNKCRMILNCPEMYKAHRFCYNIDWDNVDESVEEKIDKLYECGKNRGFLHDEVCDDGECADESCCDESAKEDDLGAFEGVTEAAEEEEPKEEPVEEPEAEQKPEEPVEEPKAEEPADEPEAASDGAEAEPEPKDDEKNTDDGEEDAPEETPEDKQKADEEDAEKSEEEAEKDDDSEKKEKEDGKDDNSLSAEEKQNLKDEYNRLFKSIMVNNKFETSFCDLSIQDRAKVYAELAEKWTKAKPQDFMTKAEEKKLEGEEFKV